MLTEHTFDTGTVMLNYAEGGPSSGLPLVLLHGVSTRWQSVQSLLPALGQRWHVYAPDLRGHGRASAKWHSAHRRAMHRPGGIVSRRIIGYAFG